MNLCMQTAGFSYNLYECLQGYFPAFLRENKLMNIASKTKTMLKIVGLEIL